MKLETKEELYLRFNFERLHSKHNRLWGDLVKITIFIISTYIAIFGLLLRLDREAVFKLSFIINVVTFLLILFGAIVLGFLIDEIEKNRIMLNNFLLKLKNN